jgi:hypothetical protein
MRRTARLYEVKLGKAERGLQGHRGCVQKESHEYLLSVEKFDQTMKLIVRVN